MVTPCAVSLLGEVSGAHADIERCPLLPAAAPSADTQARADELTNNSK